MRGSFDFERVAIANFAGLERFFLVSQAMTFAAIRIVFGERQKRNR